MKLRALVLATCLGGLLWAHPAHASESPADDYRWQLASADGASCLLLIGAMASRSSVGLYTAGVAGTAGLLFAPPLIHVLHGRRKVALIDLTLRALVPTALGFAGGALAEATPPRHVDRPLWEMASGTLFMTAGASFVTAIVLDATTLGRAPVTAGLTVDHGAGASVRGSF